MWGGGDGIDEEVVVDLKMLKEVVAWRKPCHKLPNWRLELVGEKGR